MLQHGRAIRLLICWTSPGVNRDNSALGLHPHVIAISGAPAPSTTKNFSLSSSILQLMHFTTNSRFPFVLLHFCLIHHSSQASSLISPIPDTPSSRWPTHYRICDSSYSRRTLKLPAVFLPTLHSSVPVHDNLPSLQLSRSCSIHYKLSSHRRLDTIPSVISTTTASKATSVSLLSPCVPSATSP
jgi:hypothetical protein